VTPESQVLGIVVVVQKEAIALTPFVLPGLTTDPIHGGASVAGE
jgi:hypothetical protein